MAHIAGRGRVFEMTGEVVLKELTRVPEIRARIKLRRDKPRSLTVER